MDKFNGSIPMHHSPHPHGGHGHHPPTQNEPDMSKFFVVTVISNPVRYKRRYELYWRFKEMCESSGVKLITVEQAFGHRPFLLTSPNNPYNLQLRTVEELWHKENMINLGIKHALATFGQENVREVAWVDADCRPAMMPRQWFEETWHQLQHYEFVQMWENLIDLDVYHNSIGAPQPSFMSNYIKYGTPNPVEFKNIQAGKAYLNKYKRHQHHPKPVHGYNSTIFGRPGLAWAANVSALNQVGGLIERCPLGAGDWYMAHGLVGSMNVTYSSDTATSAYARYLLDWQTKAEHWIKRDVGFVPGTVYHDEHGKKIKRGYGTRGKILTDNNFDPYTDLKPDSQGLLQLETVTERQMKLRDEIRAYFRARHEDELSF